MVFWSRIALRTQKDLPYGGRTQCTFGKFIVMCVHCSVGLIAGSCCRRTGSVELCCFREHPSSGIHGYIQVLKTKDVEGCRDGNAKNH